MKRAPQSVLHYGMGETANGGLLVSPEKFLVFLQLICYFYFHFSVKFLLLV